MMTATRTRTDAGLATALRISVSRLARRLRAQRATAGLTEAVLSETQLAALSALEVHPAMTPGELADHEKVQPPSMTRVIAVLEERNLVLRSPHPTDRRQVILTVTEEGRAVVQRVRRRKDAWLDRRLAELTDAERATLRAAVPILEKLSQSSLGRGGRRRPQRPAGQRGVPRVLGRAEPAADQVQAVRRPRLALIAAERLHQLGDVGRGPAPGQGQVRLEAAAPVGRGRAGPAGAGGDGLGQPGQRAAITGYTAPEHVRPAGRREGARAGEREHDLVVPPGGALQARQQPGRGDLVDLAEEGQGHVPGLLAGPAQVEARGPERLHLGVELVEHGRGRGDGHEQPHEFPRSGDRYRGPLDPLPRRAGPRD